MSEESENTTSEPSPSNRDKPKLDSRMGSLVAVFAVAVLFGVIFFILPRGGDDEVDNGPDDTVKRDVILISVDTLRADYLACYGHPSVKTPHLDALAEEGVLFERCYTPYPLTLPAHASMLSGTTPVFHRVRGNTYHRVPRGGLRLIQEEFDAAGFETGGFVSSSVMGRHSGIARGFKHYDDKIREAAASTTLPERNAEKTLGAAQKWIEGLDRDKHAFTFIHLFDPHFPFWPPDAKARGLEKAVRFTGEEFKPLYQAEVEYTDTQLGKFFQWLKDKGRYDDALIIVTADHGEGLDERGELTHGYFVHDETTHVPLIIKPPKGQGKAGRIAGIVQLQDLVPTMAEFSGLELSKEAKLQQQGVKLSAMIRGERKDFDRNAYIESHYGYYNAGWAKLRAIRSKTSLAVISSTNELFLDSDPKANVVNAPEHREEFRKAYEQVQETLNKYYSETISNRATPRKGSAGYPGEGYPGEGYPGEGYPGEGYPGEGYPGEGYPGEGYPGEGYPGEAYPGESYPGEMGSKDSASSPYPAESLNKAAAAAKESLTDVEGLDSPHLKAEVLSRYQQAELFFSEGKFNSSLRVLNAVLADESRSLQALKLAARIHATQAATVYRGDKERSRASVMSAAEHATRAAEVAESVGLHLGALEIGASAQLYKLMLATEEEEMEAVRVAAVDAITENPMMPRSLRLKYLRLRFIAAYRKASDDNARAALGARMEKQLGKVGKAKFGSLIDLMKSAKPVPIAPWER